MAWCSSDERPSSRQNSGDCNGASAVLPQELIRQSTRAYRHAFPLPLQRTIPPSTTSASKHHSSKHTPNELNEPNNTIHNAIQQHPLGFGLRRHLHPRRGSSPGSPAARGSTSHQLRRMPLAMRPD